MTFDINKRLFIHYKAQWRKSLPCIASIAIKS